MWNAGVETSAVALLALKTTGAKLSAIPPAGRQKMMPGEVSLLPPGRDAWVVGHEP